MLIRSWSGPVCTGNASTTQTAASYYSTPRAQKAGSLLVESDADSPSIVVHPFECLERLKTAAVAGAGQHRTKTRPKRSNRMEQDKLECLDFILRRQSLPKEELVATYARRAKHVNEKCQRVFSFDGPDEHIRQALLQQKSGWIENRVRGSPLWDFKWTVTDSEADYKDLAPGSFFNHFQNNRELTTKAGLTETLRQLAASEHVDVEAFFPRSYSMSAANERDDFVLDYRRCAALNVAKQYLRLRSHEGVIHSEVDKKDRTYLCDVDVLHTSLTALKMWLQDLDGTYFDDGPNRLGPISCKDWDALVLYSAVTDAQLCRQEDCEQRRDRNRRYSASGGAIQIMSHCWSNSPRAKAAQRPSDFRLWPEFSRHVWTSAVPRSLDRALDEAVRALEAQWPQIGTHGPMNVWIVKPGTSSKGSGVACMQSLPELLHHCEVGVNRIVQKYVERPMLLYSGRKFDIRQWVLVRSFEPMQAFMFSSCYLRLCNEPYDLGDLTNRQRHISNWSVNREGKHVAQGAVASLDDFRMVLQEVTGRCDVWDAELVPRIRHAILSCLDAVRERVVQRSACFELYGFDFLIGEDLKPWLLEVNLSPACEARTPFISAMLERMSTRLLEIVVDEKVGPDGIEPDWICIANEVSNRASIAMKCGDVGSAALASESVDVNEWSPCAPGWLSDIQVVGRALFLPMEKRFEVAYRRREAQALISRLARGFLARREARRRRQNTAAYKLQRIARIWLARVALARRAFNDATLEVQKQIRRFQAHVFLLSTHRNLGAASLQRLWRGYMGRRHASFERRHRAVVRIQRRWRGAAQRRRLKARRRILYWWRQVHACRVVSAIRLQSKWRAALERRHYLFLLHHVERPSRILLQTLGLVVWRGHLRCSKVHAAALFLQRAWRGCHGRACAGRLRKQKAVFTAWHHGTAVATDAVLVLQSFWRGASARRNFAVRRRSKCCIKAACRRHLDHAMLISLQWIAAATRLQAFWRGSSTRRFMECMIKSAILIESRYRGFCCRRAARLRRQRLQWIAMERVALNTSAIADVAAEVEAFEVSCQSEKPSSLISHGRADVCDPEPDWCSVDEGLLVESTRDAGGRALSSEPFLCSSLVDIDMQEGLPIVESARDAGDDALSSGQLCDLVDIDLHVDVALDDEHDVGEGLDSDISSLRHCWHDDLGRLGWKPDLSVASPTQQQILLGNIANTCPSAGSRKGSRQPLVIQEAHESPQRWPPMSSWIRSPRIVPCASFTEPSASSRSELSDTVTHQHGHLELSDEKDSVASQDADKLPTVGLLRWLEVWSKRHALDDRIHEELAPPATARPRQRPSSAPVGASSTPSMAAASALLPRGGGGGGGSALYAARQLRHSALATQSSSQLQDPKARAKPPLPGARLCGQSLAELRRSRAAEARDVRQQREPQLLREAAAVDSIALESLREQSARRRHLELLAAYCPKAPKRSSSLQAAHTKRIGRSWT